MMPVVYRFAVVAIIAAVAGTARGSSINQSTTWTIERSNATATYRVVGYGDSIFAGYRADFFDVALRSSPYVLGEYAATVWKGNIEVVRRTKSGAVAQEIYDEKITGESSYMADPSTGVVMFEMCGNDFLQAREAFAATTGTCDRSGLDSALASCTTYMEKAMQAIIATAPSASIKLIGNLYYPSYAAENVDTGCTDATSGEPLNMQDLFIGYLAHSNWRACHFAAQYGFLCIDSFAQIMGSDYDGNGDGMVDSEALRYSGGEDEDAYVTRISQTLRPTIIDANTHFTNAGTSYDYIFSDDIHPTPYTDATVTLSYFGEGSGSGPPTFQDTQIADGENPVWNQFGHERFGWTASALAFPPDKPAPTPPPPEGTDSGPGGTSPGSSATTGTGAPAKKGGCSAIDVTGLAALMCAAFIGRRLR
jgi:hypothetical protein